VFKIFKTKVQIEKLVQVRGIGKILKCKHNKSPYILDLEIKKFKVRPKEWQEINLAF
jgi:hypothetical protein